MTFTATLTVDRDFRLAPLDRRLFGVFVEHLGRCVYNGIHEPGHPTADEQGFRRETGFQFGHRIDEIRLVGLGETIGLR